MEGFAALLWLRGEDKSHLRDSRKRNADRGKEPSQTLLKEKTHVYIQRKTR